ncbi:hypothetical protein ACIQC5_12955 [Paenarthrobacter sp. NPDC092416]|uniref:hypothetical protein n=1 Tax=Paenarthrobacter sp. NPDC092416 TaxID=3364386 RepID=UPI0038169C44
MSHPIHHHTPQPAGLAGTTRTNKLPNIGKTAPLALLLGVTSALLGLAPWLTTGAILPLQNLWSTQTLPADMPLSLLPVSQYKVTVILSLMTVGGAVAGLAVRAWAPARRRLVTWCALAGVFAVHGTATVQAFAVVERGLEPGSRSSLYLAGLLAGALVAVVASFLSVLLLSAKSRAWATLGAGLMALPFASWITEWAVNATGPGDIPSAVLTGIYWLPPVLVGTALAWCGLRPASRAIVWTANLALLWLVPAIFTSVNYVLGTRITLGDLDEMALMSRQILAATLGPQGQAGPRVLTALAIGLAGTVALALIRRRRMDVTTAASSAAG